MNEALQFQMLTPARLRWVLDIGETTEAEWRAETPPAVAYFKRGRCIRYHPASVLEFIQRHTRKAPAARAELPARDWARLERLIADQVRAQKQMGVGRSEIEVGRSHLVKEAA